MIVSIILLLLLGLSVLLNIGGFFSSAALLDTGRAHAGPRLEEVLVESRGSQNKIAIVPIQGVISDAAVDPIGTTMVTIIKSQLERAADDQKVKAVILKVDSPGGGVMAADEIHDLIADFQKRNGKPVIASMGGLAASGGYYVSAPCRWIVAHEMTITGSIGVIMSTWNYRGLMDKVGLRPFTFKSGKFKDMLSGSKNPDEITEEEKEMIQKIIDQTYDKFTTIVAEGRKSAASKNQSEGRVLEPEWKQYADGRILTGSEAYEYGFVDELGNFEAAVDRALDIAGVTNANLIEYRQRLDFADLLGIFGQSGGKSVKLDIGLEPPKLEAGKPYFLYLP